MRRIILVLLIAILAVFVHAPKYGNTDLAPLREQHGGVVAVKSPHQTVRLNAQRVTIQLGKGSYVVDAVYHFFNTGETTTQRVGFEKRWMRDVIPYLYPAFQFHWFNTWVDGRKVPISEEIDLTGKGLDLFAALRRDAWMACDITFPGHKRKTIRVNYQAPYYLKQYVRTAHYIYGSGAYWLDDIGKAVFVIDGSRIGGSKRFRVQGLGPHAMMVSTNNHEIYEIRNFEPDPRNELEIEIKP